MMMTKTNWWQEQKQQKCSFLAIFGNILPLFAFYIEFYEI